MFGKYQIRGLTILSILLLVGLSGASLSVYNWQTLEQADPALLDIPFSIANYGFAP
jgi:hypothetical protein